MRPYGHVKPGRYPGLGDTYFRSRSEAQVAAALKIMGWAYIYEPKEFLFPVKRGTISYRPDFRVCDPQRGWRWLEVKGYWTLKAKTQLKRFAHYYPEEAQNMIIVTDWEGVQEWIAARMKKVAPTVEVWKLEETAKLAEILWRGIACQGGANGAQVV